MIKKKFLIFELIIVAFITSCASSNVNTKINLAENTIIEDKHDEDVEEDNKLTRSDDESITNLIQIVVKEMIRMEQDI